MPSLQIEVKLVAIYIEFNAISAYTPIPFSRTLPLTCVTLPFNITWIGIVVSWNILSIYYLYEYLIEKLNKDNSIDFAKTIKYIIPGVSWHLGEWISDWIKKGLWILQLGKLLWGINIIGIIWKNLFNISN